MNYNFIKNQEKYFEFIRELRNDDSLISGFIEQAKITADQQIIYMSTHKDDYYIALFNDEPVGFIGVVNNDIRLAVRPEFQRKGVASFMLNEIGKIYKCFEVQVKENNIASLEMFKKNGFVEIGLKDKNNQKLIVMKKGQSND